MKGHKKQMAGQRPGQSWGEGWSGDGRGDKAALSVLLCPGMEPLASKNSNSNSLQSQCAGTVDEVGGENVFCLRIC